METKTVPAILRARRGSYDRFYNTNRIYKDGEITVVNIGSGEHEGKVKVGDGKTQWRDLQWVLGTAATIQVGSTDTIAPGGNAAVSNSGTIHNAILNFEIPKGERGDDGDPGQIVPDITGLTEKLIPYNEDSLYIYDDEAGALKSIKFFNLKEALKEAQLDFEHPVGDIQFQLPNMLSPIDKGWGQEWALGDPVVEGRRLWEICSSRACEYRLIQGNVPPYTIYTQGANYGAGVMVMYHLPGDDWAFFVSREALTGVPEQLDPVKWNKVTNGEIVEQRFLHAYTEPDFTMGQQIIGGEYDGYNIAEIITYGGKFLSVEGGNRPPFINGGTGQDASRLIIGRIIQITAQSSISEVEGVFKLEGENTRVAQNVSGGPVVPRKVVFDNSFVTPTASENQSRTLPLQAVRRIA